MDQEDNDILRDNPFEESPSPEEIEAAEQDELLARRIRSEVRRIERGEAAEDMEREAAEEIEKREAERREIEEEEERERREQEYKSNNIFWLLLSGGILQKKFVSKYYSKLAIIATLFLVSIFVMFWSLHLDMRYNQELRMVQLLRERSARLQELRYTKCSHSAISTELQRKNSKLQDATQPAVVVESKGWFNR